MGVVFEYRRSIVTPHWLYPDLKNLISEQSLERAVAILYPQRLNLGRGGPHESAIGATGPGARWDKRPGHHHGTRRRCGPPDRPHGQDGLCRGARSAYPPALAATRTQLGLDGRDLAGLSPPRRRSPEGVGGSGHPGHAPPPEPPEWADHPPLGLP